MQTLTAVFSPAVMAYYLSIFLALALLYRAVPAARQRLRLTAFLAVCSIAGITAAEFFGGISAGGLAKVIVILSRLLAAISAVNVAGVLVFSVALPKVHSGMSKFLEDLILAGGYVAAGFVVISASGANLSGILATSAVVTGVVAFSLQDTLGNVIGGMVLHLEDSFKPGDWVGIEKYEGVVREIRWRQTTLETLDGDLVVVPNIILMKSPVTVLGRAQDNTRFRAVPFNVYYDQAPGEVIKAVEQSFKDDRPASVAAKPEPYCAIKDFQPNCIAYEVRYYLSDLSVPGRTDSAVRAKVYYALSRAGIKLSTPIRSVVVSEGAQAVAEKSGKEELARRLRALKGAEVLQPLNDEERGVIAGRLKPTPFSGGEIITRQGTVADWLYIIYEGRAEIRLYSDGSDAFKVVKTLGPGDVLGEMGLFTGEARSATAVAAGEVRCYRLDRDGFAGVLANRPEIVEAIALMLAKRRVELAAAREKLAGESALLGLKTEQQNLLSKIKDFFSI